MLIQTNSLQDIKAEIIEQFYILEYLRKHFKLCDVFSVERIDRNTIRFTDSFNSVGVFTYNKDIGAVFRLEN